LLRAICPCVCLDLSNYRTDFDAVFFINIVNQEVARWPRGQYARRTIADAKQRSQWSVIGWVTKIYYIELLRTSEGTLTRCICSHWHPLQFQGESTSGNRMVVKIIAKSLSQHDKKFVVPTSLSGIRVGKRKSESRGRLICI
jgi:hypothetical protein